MAVPTTYLAKVKMALRISSDAFDSQLTDLCEEALLDLTKTADVKTFDFTNIDALQSGAIISYVAYRWFDDEKYFRAYNDLKEKMLLSTAYGVKEEGE